jgi:hypothetical protein
VRAALGRARVRDAGGVGREQARVREGRGAAWLGSRRLGGAREQGKGRGEGRGRKEVGKGKRKGREMERKRGGKGKRRKMGKKKGKRRNGGRKKGKERKGEKKGVTRAGDIRGGDRGWSATRAGHSHAARGEKGEVTAVGFGCRFGIPGN